MEKEINEVKINFNSPSTWYVKLLNSFCKTSMKLKLNLMDTLVFTVKDKSRYIWNSVNHMTTIKFFKNSWSWKFFLLKIYIKELVFWFPFANVLFSKDEFMRKKWTYIYFSNNSLSCKIKKENRGDKIFSSLHFLCHSWFVKSICFLLFKSIDSE